MFIPNERPGFESYQMMNMPMGIPSTPYIMNQSTCLDSSIKTLEAKVNNLENRVSKLENNMYPGAVDYTKATYQNSLNMM